MLKLKNITLVAISSVKIEETINALINSMNGIEYGGVKFISDIHPKNMPDEIDYVKCDPLNYIGYSQYVFLELHKHVDTDFCISVQHDGWIVKPDCWDEKFLDFDYIGAPWEYSESAYMTDYGEHVRVGNGGVSLKSKKMLQMPIDLGLELKQEQGYYNEDGNCCVYHRRTLLDNGIRYAPVELAAKFSREKWIDGISRENAFAFHGLSNRGTHDVG